MICTMCGIAFEEHPVTGEITCLLHGRPDGSEFEKQIWERAKLVLKVRPVVPVQFTRDEMGYKS